MRFLGEALSVLNATHLHRESAHDPAEVRIGRAVRVLTELVTLIEQGVD